MIDKLSLPFTFVELVRKVQYYTGNEDCDNGLMLIAEMAEEHRLKCRSEIFNLQVELEKTKHMIDNKSWNLSFDNTSAAQVKACAEVFNRCADHLTMRLKEMLRPVWNVYWGESCTGLAIISTWVLRAEEDGGKKVFARLSELGK